MNEVLDAAWSMMVTVDDCAEVVLSGVPRKSEPHRLLLPPPQTQRRPHGTGLEPAGPTARPSGEAETAVVAWTPRGHRSRGEGVCKEMDQGRFRGTSRIPRCAFDIHLEVREWSKASEPNMVQSEVYGMARRIGTIAKTFWVNGSPS